MTFLNAVPKFVSVIDTFVFDLEQDLESKSNFIHAGLIAFMLLAFCAFSSVCAIFCAIRCLSPWRI